MKRLISALVVVSLAAAVLCIAVAGPSGDTEGGKLCAPPFDRSPAGGSNSPEPSDPPRFVLKTVDLSGEGFAVRVPTGSYTAPEGGAPNYTVPGPIVAFQGPDGQWRGRGYLETYPRLTGFTGSVIAATSNDGRTRDVALRYTFEGGKTYEVKLIIMPDCVLMTETSDLGPRNLYVMDMYYNWQPTAGFAARLIPAKRDASRPIRPAFVYLPCFYDKPEATLNPTADLARLADDEHRYLKTPGAVAVTSAEPGSKDVAGFFCRQVADWKNGDTMGLQLWQRRQLPGDPGSRHFLGPETKSDSPPNPRTAGLLGKSLYEGHVTVELNLGVGTRKLGFTAVGKGSPRPNLAVPFLGVYTKQAN